MTDTQTPDLFAGVTLDNNTHTVQVRWRDTIPVTPGTLEDDKQYADIFGYTWYEWDDIDRDDRRVTLTRVVARGGHTVELYETSYFTRVKCADCEYSYADRYQVVTTPDATSQPVARCSEHAHRFRRSTFDLPGVTVHDSAYLRIGQHA